MIFTELIHSDVESCFKAIHKKVDNSVCYNDTFLTGKLGLVYYYFNCYLFQQNSHDKNVDNEYFREKGFSLLQEVFTELNDADNGQLQGAFLSGGAVGFAYCVDYLSSKQLIDFDTSTELKDIDDYIYESARKAIQENRIDFLHGACGCILYYALQNPGPRTIERLNNLVELLLTKALKHPTGIYFINEDLINMDRTSANFGIAHGLSGLLLVLLKSFPRLNNSNKQHVLTAVKEGVSYILHHRIGIGKTEKHISIFPIAAHPETGAEYWSNRLAWCYGDLNMVLLFYRAGKLLNDQKVLKIAKQTGYDCTGRFDAENTMIEDAWFCHGSSGVAKIFQSLYFDTGDPLYWEAYTYWIGRTVETWATTGDTDNVQFNAASFLEGYTGASLILSEYLSRQRIDWAKIFLL